MKKSIYVVMMIVVLVFASVLPGQARDHFSFHGGVWIGPGWGGWGPWWWGAPYYPAYPYYYNYWAPPVVQEQSPGYVQPTPQVEEQTYWYFCPDTRNYYPYVKKCPSGWLKVVPPSGPPDEEE